MVVVSSNSYNAKFTTPSSNSYNAKFTTPSSSNSYNAKFAASTSLFNNSNKKGNSNIGRVRIACDCLGYLQLVVLLGSLLILYSVTSSVLVSHEVIINHHQQATAANEPNDLHIQDHSNYGEAVAASIGTTVITAPSNNNKDETNDEQVIPKSSNLRREDDVQELHHVQQQQNQNVQREIPPPPEGSRRTTTDTGIDVSDPNLFSGTDDEQDESSGDSSTSTIIALATGYPLPTYQRFVGSLRKTGYKGKIILGVHPNIDDKTIEYMNFRNVTIKKLQWTNCTYAKSEKEKNDIFKKTTCAVPYPDIKIRWSRFPLARDWLVECKECTGPVLLMDARDSIFQLDPFGPGSPPVRGLQVFQEHVAMTTKNWLTQWPIKDCKGVEYDAPMLCSGTTVGTRTAMIKYLEIMYAEMKVWIEEPKCRFDINGDDQSIHNYLYYSGQLPFATSIVNRRGGIVNTIGHEASRTMKQHIKTVSATKGIEEKFAEQVPFDGANDQTWMGTQYGLVNEYGKFIEFDGSISRVVHQYDRIGSMYHLWLNRQKWSTDNIEFEEYLKNRQNNNNNGQDSSSSAISRRTQTDTGVDISDPALYNTIAQTQGDSSTSTVIALATGYPLATYERFVGSLRKTGYKGKIILGVHPDVNDEVMEYMKFRDVTVKKLQWTNCTYTKSEKEKNDIFKQTKCAVPYPDIKIRWSRFPLARDWLVECKECTGPVLLMDARDSVFQLDPFGPGSPPVQGLQVFQEHVRMTTKNWLTQWPIKDCKGVEYDAPMLCSGTTIGTREAMIKYLEIMYEEMKVWIEEPKCRFDINGDDQSIHNYLYYSGQLPFATSIVNRKGGIVNTIGHEASITLREHIRKVQETKGVDKATAEGMPFDGVTDRTWMGPQYGLVNEDGKFIDFDGAISRVVHQYDRIGDTYDIWLNHQDWSTDHVDFQLYRRQQRQQYQQQDNQQDDRQLSQAYHHRHEPNENDGQQNTMSISASTQQDARRIQTDTGIDVSDPVLFDGVDLNGDSSTSTVIALATGYKLPQYQRFIGSLRKSGYRGHIILGLHPDVDDATLNYMKLRNVTVKKLQWTSCTYTKSDSEKNDIFKETTCADPYPDIKIRWSRFPLARDWLVECEECTGPVLLMDARDAIFQLDPFGPGAPKVTGLQVFQEHVNMTTKNWLTQWPIKDCKGVEYDEPMLCSGTTIGTRAAMIKYLEIMYAEMKVWIEEPKCRFDINGDDQSIHNYLYYSGQLPFATSIANRRGGIVNTIGHEATQTLKGHINKVSIERGIPKNEAQHVKFEGANDKTWIGTEYGLTNDDGKLIEYDGTVSRVVHQYDRFGITYDNWLTKQSWATDKIDQNQDDALTDQVFGEWKAVSSTE